jgi:hypothetical protein
LRSHIRQANARIKQASKARETELDTARAECNLAMRSIKLECQKRRKSIRARAKREQAKWGGFKDEAREAYRWWAGRAPTKHRLSVAESDSLAAHNIPEELLPIWRSERRRYDYALSPDARAEQFLEWVESEPDEVRARLMEHWQLSDLQLAKAERAAYDDRGEEEVPF